MADSISGVRFVVKQDSTLIGAQGSASLNLSQDLRDLVTKNNFGAVDHLSGRQEWSVSQDGFGLDQDGEVFISNGKASLELDIPDGQGGTTTKEITNLDSLSISLIQEIYERGALDKELWRYIGFAEYMAEISIEGSYIDPETSAGEVYKEIFKAKDNSNKIPFTLTVDGMTISGDVAPGDMEIAADPSGEDVTISVDFATSGDFTKGGTSLDSSIDDLIQAYFDQTKVTLGIENVDDSGTAVSGTTSFTGDSIISQIDLEFTDGEEATTSFEFAGDGELTRETIS